jgi:hypothetical protein
MFISSALFPPVVQSHKNILIDLIDWLIDYEGQSSKVDISVSKGLCLLWSQNKIILRVGSGFDLDLFDCWLIRW